MGIMFSGIGSVPHRYIWVDSNFTHKEPCGFIRAVWFGLQAFPGRAWGLDCLLENGAIYRNLPPHAIAFKEDADPWTLEEAQHWNVYGYKFTVHQFEFLAGLRVITQTSKASFGRYLFSVQPLEDAYSAEPSQAKTFTFVQLDNGRLTIQPTDRVMFDDPSFCELWGWPTGLKRQSTVYVAEEE